MAALLLLATRAWGQNPQTDSQAATTALSTLSQQYTEGLGAETRLYNGQEYISTLEHYVNGHEFFGSSEPKAGTVVYDGARYDSVLLRYDLVRGQVVLEAPSGILALMLVNEKVSRFTVGPHSFIRLVAPAADAPIRTGFYEVLADGPVRLLAAHRKLVQKRSTPSGMQGEVEKKVEYFIATGNDYYKVSNANSVLRLFPEHKGALRKYIKSEKLDFKKPGRERALSELVRYSATLASAAPAPPAN
jgi:hypothetical protein